MKFRYHCYLTLKNIYQALKFFISIIIIEMALLLLNVQYSNTIKVIIKKLSFLHMRQLKIE